MFSETLRAAWVVFGYNGFENNNRKTSQKFRDGSPSCMALARKPVFIVIVRVPDHTHTHTHPFLECFVDQRATRSFTRLSKS